MRVCSVNNCLRPFREQNSLYRLIPLGVCFWLLIKFIFRSPRIYILLGHRNYLFLI